MRQCYFFVFACGRRKDGRQQLRGPEPMVGIREWNEVKMGCRVKRDRMMGSWGKIKQ